MIVDCEMIEDIRNHSEMPYVGIQEDLIIESSSEIKDYTSSCYTFAEQPAVSKAMSVKKTEKLESFGVEDMQQYLGLGAVSHSEPSYRFGHGAPQFSLR